MSLNHTAPDFFIGHLPIHGRVMLAPMDGYTDVSFRNVARQFGSALSVSEFINGIDIKQGHPHLKNKLVFTDYERPFAYQIFDDNPERMLYSAQKLRERDPDYLDINMGCSARNVSNRGAGAGLLKHPRKISLMIEQLVKNLDIPITAKIRLGWDSNSLNYLEVAKILQENGASMIAVHARTRKQEYSGRANWNAIGEIKSHATIPVIGNGDVLSLEDANRMMTETGCDGVMIGRAAIGNPWVFSGNQPGQQTVEERMRVIDLHLSGMIDLYGERIAVILFRKHLTRYASHYLDSREIRKSVYAIETKTELFSRIESVFRSKPNPHSEE